MHYSMVLAILRYELWVFAGGLALIVSYRLLIGSINTRGLLNNKVTRAYSPARLQLLVFTLGGAVYYASLCFKCTKLVPPPNELIAILGGSNGLYLFGKFFNLRPGKGS